MPWMTRPSLTRAVTSRSFSAWWPASRADGMGVQRDRVEGVAGIAQDGEALGHRRPVALVGCLVLPNEDSE